MGRILSAVRRWFDADWGVQEELPCDAKRVDWLRILPFLILHLACLGVIWVGWSKAALGAALTLYVIRMFAITAFYHRYFSHRAFKANRFWQFLFAILGNTSAQRGPLWWAAHHRHHHQHTDRPEDVHSPLQHGFLWSHVGWLTSRSNFATRMEHVRDWAVFPELRWINRFDTLVPVAMALALYGLGEALAAWAPEAGTNGLQMLVWGFFISTVVLFHATCTINSLDHMWGSRRYDTPDTSRNNPLLAILTLGEGWHNNHHHYAVSARQGFFWWELDITYAVLVLLSRVGVIRDLKPLPARVRISPASKSGEGSPEKPARG
jgi:stearoyl-CoA desaturase (delta-9 desaturase)